MRWRLSVTTAAALFVLATSTSTRWAGIATGTSTSITSAGDVRIAVFGDPQPRHEPTTWTQIAGLMHAQNPTHYLGLGDLIQDDPRDWWPKFLAPFIRGYAGGGVALARGNHDGGWFAVLGPVFAYRSWFARTWGEMRVVVLDSNQEGWCRATRRPGGAQERWLMRELASPAWRNARWRILAYHHPAECPPLWSFKDCLYDEDPDLVRLRDAAIDAGARLILRGHSHSYSRRQGRHGAWLVVSGGAGGALEGPQQCRAATRAESRHHFLLLTVRCSPPYQIRVSALGLDGQPFDSFVIQ